MPTSSTYAAPIPHDSLEEIFLDVFRVHGSTRMMPGTTMSRNMVVVRQNGELTIINAVRLSSQEEAALEALGTVRQVVRLGYHHVADDAYYVDHYSAEFWWQAGSDKFTTPKPTQVLGPGGALPLADAELFTFQATQFAECALLLRHHGGLLITCDSIHHHADWSYCSLPARLAIRLMGFSRTPIVVTPPWKKLMTPKGDSLCSDFERLLDLDFKHSIAAHGRVYRDTAHDEVETAMVKASG